MKPYGESGRAYVHTYIVILMYVGVRVSLASYASNANVTTKTLDRPANNFFNNVTLDENRQFYEPDSSGHIVRE